MDEFHSVAVKRRAAVLFAVESIREHCETEGESDLVPYVTEQVLGEFVRPMCDFITDVIDWMGLGGEREGSPRLQCVDFAQAWTLLSEDQDIVPFILDYKWIGNAWEWQEDCEWEPDHVLWPQASHDYDDYLQWWVRIPDVMEALRDLRSQGPVTATG